MVFPDRGFPLSCLRQERHAATKLHAHDFHELVVILGGHGRHVTEDRNYPIQAGDVFLIRGDMAHGYADTDRMALVNILFDPRRLRLPMAGLADVPGYHALFRVEPRMRQTDQFRHRLQLSPAALAEAAEIIALLTRELERKAPGYRFSSVTHLMKLIGFLSRRYFETPRVEQQPMRKMSEVLSYIEEHYREPVRMKTLARLAGMSDSTLTRAFHKVMGCSPIDHVIHVRIGRAAELLRRSNMRVTEAAFESGFTDSNYFARQFRRVMGVSPRQHRAGV
jgi:AraC family L-rhamnose operon transcriptional activator RhaR/AraC family L-rhamnose operon regulatory protein RhaS